MTVEVVAAAIVQDGRVLAARRRRDGRWEFPGGKVEDGESPEQALRRECEEELGVVVRVGREVASVPDHDLELRVFAASVRAGEPAAVTDHDRLSWLTAEELTSVDWLPLDRALLAAVAALLPGAAAAGRG